jgi:hypothetical protein
MIAENLSKSFLTIQDISNTIQIPTQELSI